MNFILTFPMALTVCARLTWPIPGPPVPQVSGGCPAPVVIPGDPERPARPITSWSP